MAVSIGTASELSISSEAVVAFYKEEWTRPIALGDMDFYTWQFIEVPYQKLTDSCCIAVEDGDIVGVMGVNERLFFLNDSRKKGAELTTWIVKESHRNRGAGPKMIAYLTSKYEVLIGMGITDDALAVYLRNGFRYLKAIPRFVKVLDWEALEAYATYVPLAKKVDRSWSKRRQSCAYEQSTLHKDALNIICETFHRDNNLFSRDEAYIQWRYLDHPIFKYEVRLINDMKKSGNGVVVVTREEKSAEGLSILHVLDFFGDKQDMPAALMYVEEIALDKGVSVVDFFCTHSAVNSFFLENGWFSTLDDTYFQFPHLFQPMELRNPATTSLIYWSKEDQNSLCDIGKLYITKQDCDFDRPVLLD